ncbi:DUF5687 family protein [Pedobacter sp. CFBP9032]|uniref:DUF5687 family protein n=1 Tax=Pedobacter sp. CFBP9032 TaxID=3096539 RepID=UPI002A6AB665|nr:DUF5687 family protein [Pedobacter sp. CFBP9032]MDY0903980.1 DUF5687 family protein [Pedobacter sp. CFBP9032]
MLSTFLSHQKKSFWRSRNRGGSIAAQIVLGFFMLYFLIVAAALGFGMAVLLPKIFPKQDAMTSFNGIILYYFALDLLMRLQLQELPTLSIIPYLHLKIPKRKIVDFLNIKALFSAFNLWPFLLFLPFCFITITKAHGTLVVLAYIVSIFSLMLLNNYLILFIKRKSISNILFTLAGLVLISGFAALEYFKIISITAGSDIVFRTITRQPLLALIFPALAFLVYKINASFLRKNLYVEELSAKQEKKVSTDYPFFNRFGKVGELAALELKLIIRHKRPRNTVLMGTIILAYGFLFYKPQVLQTNSFGMMLFAAVFMTGMSIISYGQFMFAWQSAHFDGLLSKKIDLKDFIKAKFLLFTIASTVLTIAASFYCFIDAKLVLLHLVAYLYNIGFTTVMVLFLATYNYKRIDVSRSASFNWQGMGATQWISIFPFILLPILIYWAFNLFHLPYVGLAAVGLFGLVMLLMRGFWVNFIVKRFEQQRYKIAEGFRE